MADVNGDLLTESWHVNIMLMVVNKNGFYKFVLDLVAQKISCFFLLTSINRLLTGY